MFAVLGLETKDEAVYREMLESPALGIEEIAARLTTSPDRVRACLDKLFELQLIQESFEAPGRFLAVEPAVGIQQILARQHDELIERQRQIADSHTSFIRMLSGTGAHSSRGSGIERLEGMDAVQRRLRELSHDAAREVLTFMPGGPQSVAALQAARLNDGHALGRGVTIRTIGLDGVRDDAATLDYARWLTEQRGEFRTAASLPPRMVLVDGASALIPIDPGNTRRGALCLSDPALLAPLLALFDQIWAGSTPLDTEHHHTLSDRERALLACIAQGHTDESAAKQLHVSPRTTRRMMASIMDQLGARSRFEAGLKAARLGWL
ncbi:LuxR family transcriptional regulator [Streptomyces sp. NRRL B-1677]|uniref:LuxR family transcriptional regulator n=1 Tax=Streptomyces klenkii TaxID=1420899 RepID=A0A3B0AJ35_9ACTN|nr:MULTISPECIES: helix-turn-helix transcriptional regulator [Streptomyces]MBF6049660.1 LuxR family transcriptional regulator [Streptomyces sp. NRRL B-1677]RKN60361.1 LuxR family transcriptional regulator [Streptomyces klenkii]